MQAVSKGICQCSIILSRLLKLTLLIPNVMLIKCSVSPNAKDDSDKECNKKSEILMYISHIYIYIYIYIYNTYELDTSVLLSP